jgi:hypothetical protein
MAPLQYLTGFVGSIWLVIAGVAYLATRGARAATIRA